MSIYSSVTCPKCKERELSLALAILFGRIRFCCDCGYMVEIKVNQKEGETLLKIKPSDKGWFKKQIKVDYIKPIRITKVNEDKEQATDSNLPKLNLKEDDFKRTKYDF